MLTTWMAALTLETNLSVPELKITVSSGRETDQHSIFWNRLDRV